MSAPEISIIVRAFNEARHLPRLFECLARQEERSFETIVVDSGSTDATRDIARRHSGRLIEIASPDFTFGYSLNAGIRASRGRFAVALSAHAFPMDGRWLGTLVAPLADERVAMAYGRQVGVPESKFSEGLDFARVFGPRRLVHTPDRFFANNANAAIRRDLWEQYPFDERLPGLEDLDWARHWLEAGRQVVYEPEAAVYHLHEETWRQVHRRYYREAVAARWIGVKGPRDIPFELAREAGRLVRDLSLALVRGQLRRRAGEIAGFRFHKSVGAARGLTAKVRFFEPAAREELLFDRTCRAVVISGPHHAALADVELPEVKPGDVLIKVAYEGVCGTDLEILAGTLGYYKVGKASFPIIPGHEFSGRVIRIGANVSQVRDGDRVVVECIQSCGECPECRRKNWTACDQRKEVGVIGLNGGYAEYVVVPGRFVHRVPAAVSLRLASLCEPTAVVLKGLRRLERTWGANGAKRCLVVGAGPIGSLCARILTLRGHLVTAYDRSPIRRSYLAGTPIGTLDRLDDLNDYDVLVEATGDPDALDKMLHRSAPGAAILLLGLPYARREYSFEDLVAYDKTIVGSVGSSAEEFEEALQVLPKIDTARFFEVLYPLDQYQAAWQAFRERRGLKVCLEVDPMSEESESRP